ncbi:MAG: TonB-dependent receptor [Cyclobacteriaceae bacterium]
MIRNLRACLLVLLSFVWIGSAFSQDTYKLSGQVNGSDDDEGLPGVTISIKGTTQGTTTDIDGYYQINVSEENILVFSFIGYKTTEIQVNGKTTLDVELPQDIEALEEVVIVGYGEQKKANLTGAITTVDPEEIEDLPVGNLSLALVGKLAGVQVNRSGTGIPGTPSRLVVRDESASGMSRQVLYVIDGVIYSDAVGGIREPGPSGAEIFNRLDPSEIESISILKDAAASVYGARGSGGVVLVKTKRGKSGKLKFNYNGSVGIGQPTRIPEMLSGPQHAQIWNASLDIRKSLGQRPSATDYFDENEMAIINANDYDWLDGLYKEAVTYRHSMNVSGGTENIRYFVAGNYYLETGNYDNLWYKRYGIRSNLQYYVNKSLTLGLSMNISEGNRKSPNYDPGSGNTGEGVLRDWYKRPLTASKWVPPTYNGLPVNNGTWNPYGLLQSNNYKTSGSNNTNLRMNLDYEMPFINGLKFNTMISYNIDNSVSNTFGQDYLTYNFYNASGEFISENPSSILISNSEGIREQYEGGKNYQWDIGLNYNRSFDNHNVSGTIVYEQAQGSSRGFNVQKLTADIRGFNYLWAFQNSGIVANGLYSNLARWSVIGRLNYDYKGKYLFESSFRSESSTKFAPAERKGIFPAASVGWVISEEPFFYDNIELIDFFKVRFSAGLVGNDYVGAFEWKPAFTAGEQGPIFGTGDGAISNAIKARKDGFVVPSRTWAKTKNYNMGIDLSAFDNRFSMSAEYYYALTYDAFVSNSQVPYELGNAKPPLENYKESFSTGYEFQIGYNHEFSSDMKLSLDANFSSRRSRPLKLYQNADVIGTWADELLNDDSNQPGYIALGIIRTDEDLAKVQAMYPTIPSNGQDIPVAKGMIYYADVGGPNYSNVPDGKLDGNDRRIIAEYTTPPYSYGFSLGYSLKAFRLNANFGGVFGHKEFIQKDEQVVDTGSNSVVTPTASTFGWWGDYWTEENPDAKLPRPAYYGFDGQVSTFWMRNGHTLRLNNVTFSYQMPEKIATKMKLSNMRFYTSVTNVWTIISPYDWKDPAVSRAFDYPLVRTTSLGLSFSI